MFSGIGVGNKINTYRTQPKVCGTAARTQQRHCAEHLTFLEG